MNMQGPAVESYFAWQRYTEPQRDVFGEWRKKTRDRLRRQPSAGGAPESPQNLAEALEQFSATAGEYEGNAFYAAAVRPYWKRIAIGLEKERTARGRDVLEGGMACALNRIHPAVRWEAPVLHVADDGPDREVELLGRGLVLVPSFFARQPRILDPAPGGDGALLLVYNVAQDAATVASLWQDQPADSALPPLLGRTRADVMECLRMTGTTGEIARRLRISNPAVSQHIGVLRRAGLVATERRHNAAVHILTPLGEAVLG
ncbi:winged helix-turn-helix domain-containing protein [Streptomyces sp. NPDC002536]